MTQAIDHLERSENHLRGYRVPAIQTHPELPPAAPLEVDPREARIMKVSKVIYALYPVVLTLVLSALVLVLWK